MSAGARRAGPLTASWLPACLVLAACAGEGLGPASQPDPVSVVAEVDRRKAPSGEPVLYTVTVVADAGWSAEVPAPDVPELVITPLDGVSRDEGGRLVTQHAWRLRGADGSYVLPPLEVAVTGPAGEAGVLATPRIFLDLGVEGPSSALQDLALLPPPEPATWPYWAGGGVAVLGAGALLAWLFLQRPREPERIVPPDEIALAAWASARERLAGDEHALAIALSSIFRQYLEAVLAFPATAQTTFQIRARLRDEPALDPEHQERCKRLLTATDLIKFARRGGGPALFEQLDGDLRAVVERTRPRPEVVDV